MANPLLVRFNKAIAEPLSAFLITAYVKNNLKCTPESVYNYLKKEHTYLPKIGEKDFINFLDRLVKEFKVLSLYEEKTVLTKFLNFFSKNNINFNNSKLVITDVGVDTVDNIYTNVVIPLKNINIQ